MRRVGGLADTIVDVDEETIRSDAATGFAFQEADGRAMLDGIDRALAAFAQPVLWRKIVRRAMTQDFSWEASARRYLSLYRDLAPGASVPDVEDAELLAPRGEERKRRTAAA